METAWIQVFVLTIAECVAPAGKTVCQEQEFTLEFLSQEECEVALDQLLRAKNASDRIIVNEDRSSCSTTVRKREVFSSIDVADEALQGTPGWRKPDALEAEADFAQVAHEKRLATIPPCDAAADVFPCRQGQIILEEAPDRKIEIWRVDED